MSFSNLTGPRVAALAGLALLPTACDSPSSPWDSPSPPPTVEVSADAGAIPVTGRIALVPDPAGRDWAYAVDLDGDGEDDASGELPETVDFQYRFETHGVHQIRVTFTRPPAGRVPVVERIVAFDPDRVPGLTILNRRLVPVPDETARPFEGIVAGPTGRDLYVASYSGATVYRLDAEALAVGDSVHVGGKPEGLAAGPDGRTLLAIHKSGGLSVLDPSTMIQQALYRSAGGFYVAFLDAASAIAGGDGSLHRIDLDTGEEVASLHDADGPVHGARHFAISPGSRRVAVIGDDGVVRIADARSLEVERILAPAGLERARAIAYHPAGDRLYVVDDRRSEPQRLLVVDPVSGDVRSNESLEPETCWVFCVANPVATSRQGTWIVFAEQQFAYVVDTRTDRVALRIDGRFGSGVAASAVDDDVLYFVDGLGVVTKVRLRL